MAEVDTSFYPKAPAPNAFLDTAQGYVDLARSGTAYQQDQLNLVKDQVGQLVNTFSALAADPNLSVETIKGQGDRLVKLGLIAPEQLQTELAAIPPGATGDQLRTMMGNYALRALDAGQRFSAQYGSPQMVDTGNALIPTTVSPMTGIHPLGAPIQKTLSPTELASPTTIGTTPAGQPIQGTLGQYLEKTGVNPLTGLPQPQQGGNALMPSGPGVVTTLPAGQIPAMEETGRASGAALAAAREREATFQQDITPLLKAIPALETLGQTKTGVGSEQMNEIRSFLVTLGMADAQSVEDTKLYDEARKYLTQFAQVNGDTNTNDKLAAAFAGNPSTNISNAAATDVAKTALSLRKLQNAQLMAFEASGLPENQFTQFASQFNAIQDPRAYGLDMMTPEARTKLISSLSGDEKARFAQSLRTAIQLGLVQPPGATNGQ